MDKELQQLIPECDLDGIGGREFESPITCSNSNEMVGHQLGVMANHMILMGNMLCSPHKSVKCLITAPKTEQKDASTSTQMFHENTSLVVLGRLHQKLEQSETMIYDHTANKVIQISAPRNLPILKTSQLVLEDAPQTPPQRAVIKITPVKLATSENGWVAKLDPPRTKSTPSRELVTEPLQRCTTSPDFFRLHRQLWRRVPIQNSTLQLTLAVKSDPQITRTESNRASKGKGPSLIPKLIPCQGITVPNVPSSPNLAKTRTPVQRQGNGDVKVAPKRMNLTKKTEATPANRKPPAKTTKLNEPKSISTPVAAHRRPGCVEPDLQQQKNLLESLVFRQSVENQRLKAKFREEQQGLMAQMLGDLNQAIEISNGQPQQLQP
ncbi:uncharacterized protein LOC128254349 isoform X2 [Drosophila gunungcola]|uniref:uncharacterized protein LOC128254349 isoform X2 n=1 Tax=Drosophila gunungcola TaxID=103775 RepID=UPI0022E12D3D|nr:uncharacterized protein LOC128254349 isoform X2 [Drosophila gunungcola]